MTTEVNLQRVLMPGDREGVGTMVRIEARNKMGDLSLKDYLTPAQILEMGLDADWKVTISDETRFNGGRKVTAHGEVCVTRKSGDNQAQWLWEGFDKSFLGMASGAEPKSFATWRIGNEFLQFSARAMAPLDVKGKDFGVWVDGKRVNRTVVV